MGEDTSGPGFHGSPFWEPLVLTPRPEDEVADVLKQVAADRHWLAALCFGVREESGLAEPDENDFFSDTKAVISWVERFRKQTRERPPPTLLAALLPPLHKEWTSATADESHSRNRLAIQLGVAVFERGVSDRGGFGSLAALVTWVRERSRQAAPRRVIPGRIAELDLQYLPDAAAKFARQPAHIDDFDEEAFTKGLSSLDKAPWWEREN